MVTKRGWLSQIHLCWFCDKVVSIVPFLKGFFGSDIRTCKRYSAYVKNGILMYGRYAHSCQLWIQQSRFVPTKCFTHVCRRFYCFKVKLRCSLRYHNTAQAHGFYNACVFFSLQGNWLPLFAAESTCPWTAVNFSNRLTFSRGKIKEFMNNT